MTRTKLFTIGYEKATQGAVLSAVRDAGVQALVDVRAWPASRRPGFSKTSLAAAVQDAGMTYHHFRHLGTPKEGREAARKGDSATLQRIYAGQLALPEALAQMAILQDLVKRQTACLLCYCGNAEKCHRSLLAKAALPEFEVVNLTP